MEPSIRSDRAEQMSELRDLLRHLDHPERLCTNKLVAKHFEVGMEPINAAGKVKLLIEQTRATLPMRQREIIRRCDLRGQSHATVIAALAISRRQFYRDRKLAFQSIITALTSAPAKSLAPVCSAYPGDVTLLLCYADAAHQAGDVSAALQVLRKASSDAGEHSRRLQLECRVAELCCEAGAIDEANLHIRIARELSSRTEGAPDVRTARIDAVEATVAWRSGHSAIAVQRAERALSVLRTAIEYRAVPNDVEAFALALLVLSEKDVTAGRLDSARRKALEGRKAIFTSDPGRAALAIRLESAATTAYMFDPAHLSDAVFELKDQYRDAIARSLTLEATLIGWRLCNFYRFANSPHRAASSLEAMLPMVRQLLTAEERAGMCIDLASAYVACGQPARAHGSLLEARSHAVPGSYTSALSLIIDAEAYLLEHAYAEALKLSNSSVVEMQRLSRNQSVGTALRVAAEAKHALGDVGAARSLIGAALVQLESVGHPFVLAKAHRSAAHITGKRKHRLIAREISRTLEAVPL